MSQKTPFYIVTAVKTSDLTHQIVSTVLSLQVLTGLRYNIGTDRKGNIPSIITVFSSPWVHGFLQNRHLTLSVVVHDRFCVLVIIVTGYRAIHPGFDSRRYHFF
jgi:hypothetical protein